MKKKVCIMGGGVGGLACAHELAKYPDKYEVVIYERNSELGGQARSKYNNDNKYSEVCWHAVSANGYINFLNILNEITDENEVKVISHLKPLGKNIYALKDRNHIEYGKSFITEPHLFFDGYKEIYGESISFWDKCKILWIGVRANTICDERMKKYDTVKWAYYIRNLSPKLKRWALDSTAIYLGMDYNNISTHFIFNMFRDQRKSNLLENKLHNFYAFDGPINDVFFNVWQRYLISKGIKIRLNSEVQSIRLSKSKKEIDSICVKAADWFYYEKAAYFVNGMDITSLAHLYPADQNNEFFERPYRGVKEKYAALSQKGHQIQTQVLYYLPYKVQPVGTTPTIIILPDTSWFLMIRVEGDLWDSEYIDLLSTGIGIWDVPGDVFNKCAINCTREELAIECWHQIQNSQHNLKLGELPKWDIWDSFQFCEEKKEIITYEPKFSNNVDTLELRPNFKDELNNLYHANSYTKTITNTFNMESGAEAGVKVASLINETYTEEILKVKWYIKLCRWFDKILFKLFG